MKRQNPNQSYYAATSMEDVIVRNASLFGAVLRNGVSGDVM